MKNIIALAGMISILALAYVLDRLLSLARLGFVEGVPEFFTRRNVWLLPISFIIFSLTAILLAWYVAWHSRPGPFVRLAFLVVGSVGLLFPTILHTLVALFFNSVGFLVSSTAPVLSAYLYTPDLICFCCPLADISCARIVWSPAFFYRGYGIYLESKPFLLRIIFMMF